MGTFPAPTAPPLTRRHRALPADAAASRCRLTPGRPPSLLIDRRAASYALAAHQLPADGLILPTERPRLWAVAAEPTSGRQH